MCLQEEVVVRGMGGVSGSCRNGMIVCNDGTTSPSCSCEGGSSNNSSSNSSSGNSNNYYRSTPTYIYGCTNSNSINYNPSANKDDGSCIVKVYGCTNSEAKNYNPSANVDDGSCIAKVFGCTDNKAINYNSDSNEEDGSCQYSKIKIKNKVIKYKTKYKYNSFNREGKVLKTGVNGKEKIEIEEIVDKDGNVISSEVISDKVIKKPTIKIISTKNKQLNGKIKNIRNKRQKK